MSSPFSRLAKFESQEDRSKAYFVDVGTNVNEPLKGTQVIGYLTIDDLSNGKNGKHVTVGQVSIALILLNQHSDKANPLLSFRS